MKIGIHKHYQANFIMKEVLGNEPTANDECEKDVLNRLNIAVELEEEITVDFCKNNCQKPKFEDFWQVKPRYFDHVTFSMTKHCWHMTSTFTCFIYYSHCFVKKSKKLP